MAVLRKYLIPAAIAVSTCSAVYAQLPAAPFTSAQAAAGQTAYTTNCSSCHAADLGGRNEAPQLAGSNFMSSWGTRTTGELLNLIQTTMPPGNPGGRAGSVKAAGICSTLFCETGGASNVPIVTAPLSDLGLRETKTATTESGASAVLVNP